MVMKKIWYLKENSSQYGIKTSSKQSYVIKLNVIPRGDSLSGKLDITSILDKGSQDTPREIGFFAKGKKEFRIKIIDEIASDRKSVV